MTRLSIFSALLALLSVAGTALASTCMHGTDSAPSLRGGRALQNMQVYNAPTYNGYRVDWCYSYTPATDLFDGCGKVAADAFCRSHAYDQAIAFEKVTGLTEPTIHMLQSSTESSNAHATHDAFRSITCSNGGGGAAPSGTTTPTSTPTTVPNDDGGQTGANKSLRQYSQPRWEGKRVDFCATYNPNVPRGNPAAYTMCGQEAADMFCRLKLGNAKAVSFNKEAGITEPTVFLNTPGYSVPAPHDGFGSITCKLPW